MRHQHERRLDALDHGYEVGALPAQALVGRRIDLDHGLGADPHHAAVGGRIDDPLRGDVPIGARLDLDDYRAPERTGHVVGDDAGIGIDRTACRRAHDEANCALRQAFATECRDENVDRGRAGP
jgi:hypothetical protein